MKHRLFLTTSGLAVATCQAVLAVSPRNWTLEEANAAAAEFARTKLPVIWGVSDNGYEVSPPRIFLDYAGLNPTYFYFATPANEKLPTWEDFDKWEPGEDSKLPPVLFFDIPFSGMMGGMSDIIGTRKLNEKYLLRKVYAPSDYRFIKVFVEDGTVYVEYDIAGSKVYFWKEHASLGVPDFYNRKPIEIKEYGTFKIIPLTPSPGYFEAYIKAPTGVPCFSEKDE